MTTPSYIQGDFEVRKRGDSTGGNLTVKGVLTAEGGVVPASLPKATTESFGVVKIGSDINVSDGVISVGDLSADYCTTAQYTALSASVSALSSGKATKPGSGHGSEIVLAASDGDITVSGYKIGYNSGEIPYLDSSGHIPVGLIPAIVSQDRFAAASDAEMTALSGAQFGDYCVRTDLGKTFILMSDTAGGYAVLANWKELIAQTPYVTSVNGYSSQSITLTYSDVGAAPASHTHTVSEITDYAPYVLPTASAGTLGGVKVGDRLTITNGVLSADDQSYSLPTASADTLGGIKVGERLTISNGVLSATDQSYSLPTASSETLGGVKVGARLSIADGVLSADQQTYVLPTASTSTLGGVKVGSGLAISDGVLSNAFGCVIGVQSSTVTAGAINLSAASNRYKSAVSESITYSINTSALSGLNLDYLRFELDVTTGTTYGSLTFPSSVTWGTAEPVIVASQVYKIDFESFDSGVTWTARHLNPDTTERTWLGYDGNYMMTTSGPAVTLASGYYVYYVDLSEYTGGTAAFTIDSSRFGFTAGATGGRCRIVIKLPNNAANIPAITFGQNIIFADFEEIDRWESGKTYVLELITNNSGTSWIVSDVEVY